MGKLIYLSVTPLTLQMKNIFYIEECLAQGINAEFWDMSAVFWKDLRISDMIEDDYVKRLRSRKEVKELLLLEDNKGAVFVSLFTYGWDVFLLHKMLTDFRCNLWFFGRGMLPFSTGKKIKRILSYLKKGDFSKIYNAFLNRVAALCKNMNVINAYDTVFATGNKAIELFKNESKIVAINHFDYDEYLTTKNEKARLVEGKYCVFLDEYYPYHPDLKMYKMGTIEPDKYYQGLNRFFEMVEEKFNAEVVIAVHPKADYDDSVYNGRLMFKNKTNCLARHCAFVIAHSSTSISFPVLYRKPIIFIYDDQIKRLYGHTNIYPLIINFSRVLGCTLYNIDFIRQADQIRINEVDVKKYEKYKYDYLTSDITEKKLSKDIFLNHLLQLAN